MYKLYYCSATSTDHDWVEIVAAESLLEAKTKWVKEFEINKPKFDDYFQGHDEQ